MVTAIKIRELIILCREEWTRVNDIDTEHAVNCNPIKACSSPLTPYKKVYTSATQPGKHSGKQHGEQPGGPGSPNKVFTRVATRQSMPSMADIMDVDIVAAITVGLTYFYWKKKQSDRQRTVRKRRMRRRRGFIEQKFVELLNEPSGQFDNFLSDELYRF
ncbi:hypothetical protein EVAR_77124_1 [Eumeta japonica]|uniref:Uncharacterized protein n=1 Tax=Eumeta variegata TaxID=151549 RepID=A0A4C1T578_EUMVA|nr:hypothetical protein EVAR_77124_1 [Eumeta japonica]